MKKSDIRKIVEETVIRQVPSTGMGGTKYVLDNSGRPAEYGSCDCHFTCGFKNCQHEWDGDFSEVHIPEKTTGDYRHQIDYGQDDPTITCPKCNGESKV